MPSTWVVCSFRRRLSSSAKTTGRILRRRTNYYYDTNPYTASRKGDDLRRRTNRHRADALRRRLPAVERTDDARSQLPRSRSNGSSIPTRPSRTAIRSATISTGVPDSLSTLASLDLSPASFRFSNRSSTGGKGALRPTRITSDGRRCATTPTATSARCRPWTASDLLSVGLKGQYLVAEIRNAAYDEVTTALGAATVEHIRTSVVLSEGDLAALDGLRNQPQGVARHHGDIHPAGGDGLDDRSFGT